MIVETIIGALIPAVIEGGKQLLSKWIGGVRPTTVDEQIKLDQNEISRIEALARLDTPVGTPSQWVIDLRASARYVGALVVIAVGVSTLYIPVSDEIRTLAIEAANIAFGFLFGSRIVAAWGKK
jgi:hypothetical protein